MADLITLRASMSFSDDEVLALDSILSTIRRGGDARTIAKQPAAVRVAAKIVRMRNNVEDRRAAAALTKARDA